VSRLHRRPALPEGGARSTVLRRAGPAGLPPRRGAPPRGAFRGRPDLPYRRRPVPDAAGGLQPPERPGVLPERLHSGEDTPESLKGAGSRERYLPMLTDHTVLSGGNRSPLPAPRS